MGDDPVLIAVRDSLSPFLPRHDRRALEDPALLDAMPVVQFTEQRLVRSTWPHNAP